MRSRPGSTPRAGASTATASASRTLDGLRARSGAWFDPAHNGEGWSVEELPDGRAQVYWFTYDERGEQAWTVGVSPTAGDRINIADNLRPVGTRFGMAFDPAQVRNTSWGRLDLELTGHARGHHLHRHARYPHHRHRRTRVARPLAARGLPG